MKSAACWFSKRWSVRTSALGEPIERIVRLDIGTIVRDSLQELKVESSPCRDRDHFTEIVLSDLNSIPQTQTIAKIKRHLTSIYRVFIREGILELCLNDELLEYSEPGVLCVSYHKTPAGDPCDWRKEIDFDFGQGLKAKGFAALLTTGSTSGAGFALFRRKRLIQGSGDETYRPEQIFGKPNSYRYQRLFGELQLEGFDVSHTKDGFRWDGNEETFLELLREHLDAEPLPLLDQAENWRSRRKPSDWREGAIAAAQRTMGAMMREAPAALERQIKEEPEDSPPPKVLAPAIAVEQREIEVELRGDPWRIRLELSADPAVGDWISVSDEQQEREVGDTPRTVVVRLSLAHPFTNRFTGPDGSCLEPLVRVAMAIGWAEVAARNSGVKYAGTIRRNLNELLREALSRP